MLVEKNAFAHWLFWTSASSSVPGAPASSGVTFSQPAVEKPGVEMALPGWVTVELLCTSQPLRPIVLVPTERAAAVGCGLAPDSPTIVNKNSTANRMRTLDDNISHLPRIVPRLVHVGPTTSRRSSHSAA